MEPPSTRPWLGVGAALSALPAAGGCFCAALVLAVVADSDPGAVYEQHRWLGAFVAAGAVCAFVAMMGWATLRHGGLPAPVLLMALVLAAVPFIVPGGLFLPAVALAVAGCAALATAGLAHPPASAGAARLLSTSLAGTALVLAVGQAIAVGYAGAAAEPRAEVRSSSAAPEATPRKRAESSSEKLLAAPKADRAPAKPAPADAKAAPEDASPAPAKPAPPSTALAPPDVAPARPAAAAPAARRFVRDYYAALDARRFAVAWRMLAPGVQTSFGGFAAWREGYGRTLSQAPEAVRVTAAGAGATVDLTLVAGDNACGKVVERRLAVTWRLARTDAGWRATAASARKLGPQPC